MADTKDLQTKTRSALTARDIHELEQAIGRQLPKSFKEFALNTSSDIQSISTSAVIADDILNQAAQDSSSAKSIADSVKTKVDENAAALTKLKGITDNAANVKGKVIGDLNFAALPDPNNKVGGVVLMAAFLEDIQPVSTTSTSALRDKINELVAGYNSLLKALKDAGQMSSTKPTP